MTLTIRAVQAAVADEFNMPHGALTGPRRNPSIAIPRFIAMYLARELVANASFPKLGKAFGGRDHSTIISGAKRGLAILEQDVEVRATTMRALNRLERASAAENAPRKRTSATIARLERFREAANG